MRIRILGIVALFFLFPYAVSATELFSDVNEYSSYYVPLRYLKEKGYIQGYSDGSFSPEKLMTRAAALDLILKINSREALAHEEMDDEVRDEKPFRDVSEKDWFFDIVVEGKERGIIRGKGKKGRFFYPQSGVNVAEMLRMLFENLDIKTAEIEAPMPPGISSDAWYAKDIAYAVSRNLLMQTANGNIVNPGRKLTRGEFGLVLYRYLKTKEDTTFGYASWYGDGLAKTKLTSGTEFAEKNLTAAHLTLPFGTIVQVMSVRNGKKVEVVINDRGPFVTGRIIDLSKTAFSALASPGAGVIQVEVTVKR